MRKLSESDAQENLETCREVERNNFNTIMGMEKSTANLQTSLVALFQLATEIAVLRVDQAEGDPAAIPSLRVAESKVKRTLASAQTEVKRADVTIKERAELLMQEGVASLKVAMADRALPISAARG